MKALFTICSVFVVLSLVACASPVAQTQTALPTAIPNGFTDLSNSNQKLVFDMESEDWNLFSQQIRTEPLLTGDIARLSQGLQEQNAYLSFGEVTSDGQLIIVNPQTSSFVAESVPMFVVPTMQFTAQNWESFFQPFVNPNATQALVWDTLFHWTGHLENRYALGANGAWFNSIIQSAIRNEGVIYKIAASENTQVQYLFVSRIGAGGSTAPWGVFLAENGAPITGYNTALKNGLTNEQEAARFISKMLQRGYTKISPDELPAAIRNNWTTSNPPPIYRYWWWALAYRLEMFARVGLLTISDAAEAFVVWASSTTIDFIPVFFIVPDCSAPGPGNIFWCGPTLKS